MIWPLRRKALFKKTAKSYNKTIYYRADRFWALIPGGGPCCIATAAVYNRNLVLFTLTGPIVLRRFWLLFAQVATICLAVLFVVTTLRPDLLARYTGRNNVVLMQEAPAIAATVKIDSLADAAKRAMPSVVN